MGKTIFVLALSVLGFGCAKSESVHDVQRLSDDFYLTVAKAGQAVAGTGVVALKPVDDRPSCEASLTRAVCETTANTNQITRSYNSVKCSTNSAQYVPALMEIYEEMPERMRVSLCSLDRIFISDNITSTAFASSVEDSMGRISGGYVGMRKGTFLSQPTSHEIVTWKEQLAFGGSKDFLSNDPALVQIDYGLKMSTLKSDGLFYVLMHELGHLIDFNNQVNNEMGGSTAWSKMSWQTSASPLAGATYFKRDDFCSYDCQAFLDPHDAKEIYSTLQASAFITTYSSSTPYEDFAEFWAWHMMIEAKNPDFKVVIPGEASFDMNHEFTDNAKIKAKLDFVDRLWNDPKLKIDNRVH